MSGRGGGRSHVGSGEGTPDECSSLDVVTPLNSPNPAVSKNLKKGVVLTVAVQTSANNVKVLVAEVSDGGVAGSLTPPSLLTIIACIEKGHHYGAMVLDDAAGGIVRIRIQPKA